MLSVKARATPIALYKGLVASGSQPSRQIAGRFELWAMFCSQSTLPVVSGVSGDPVDAKLVQNLGTNYTGMNYLASELVGKRIEFLKDAYPTSGVLPSSRGRRRNPNSLPHPLRARQVDGPRTHRYG